MSSTRLCVLSFVVIYTACVCLSVDAVLCSQVWPGIWFLIPVASAVVTTSLFVLDSDCFWVLKSVLVLVVSSTSSVLLTDKLQCYDLIWSHRTSQSFSEHLHQADLSVLALGWSLPGCLSSSVVLLRPKLRQG